VSYFRLALPVPAPSLAGTSLAASSLALNLSVSECAAGMASANTSAVAAPVVNAFNMNIS
jgi:hypothetical protein